MRDKPLAIDLFCGLGGWAEGFLAEGYGVVGFDIERHDYNTGVYPAQLVLQDVLTLHGSQFKDAAVIVASPPCQAYSYRAMPWKRAKALPPPSNELFDACCRIQREASEAAGRYIPLVVENVKGAQPWVGRAKWHYGKFYLWGDVPALMPRASLMVGDGVAQRGSGAEWFDTGIAALPSGSRKKKSNAIEGSDGGPLPNGSVSGVLRVVHHDSGTEKVGSVVHGQEVDSFGWSKASALRDCNSHSPRRKAASAQIAKIPEPLARWIANVYKPDCGMIDGNADQATPSAHPKPRP